MPLSFAQDLKASEVFALVILPLCVATKLLPPCPTRSNAAITSQLEFSDDELVQSSTPLL